MSLTLTTTLALRHPAPEERPDALVDEPTPVPRTPVP